MSKSNSYFARPLAPAPLPALAGIAAMPEVLGAHLCVADASASSIETTERKSHGAAVPDWLVMIEGVSAAGVNAACDALADGLARHGARTGAQRGVYQLQIRLGGNAS